MRDYRQLLELGERWFELGVLTEELLGELGREYESSDDRNTEHYRYGAFRKYLEAHRPLPEEMAVALYELGDQDPDSAMGGSLMNDILNLEEGPSILFGRAVGSGRKHLVKTAMRRKEQAE